MLHLSSSVKGGAASEKTVNMITAALAGIYLIIFLLVVLL